MFVVRRAALQSSIGVASHPHCTADITTPRALTSIWLQSARNHESSPVLQFHLILKTTSGTTRPLQFSFSVCSHLSGPLARGRNSFHGLDLKMSSPKSKNGDEESHRVPGFVSRDVVAAAITVSADGMVAHTSKTSGAEVEEQDSSATLSTKGTVQSLPNWAISRAGALTPPKLLTLVIIHKEGKVLLGMKKRGFGKGYYNGFGGKVEKGETIDCAAARELQEESGLIPLDMSKRGILMFHFDNDPIAWEVHVYHVSEVVGEPCETEEMVPTWFRVPDIPYDSMWSDDVLWYPEFLEGRHFKGTFYFENTTTLVAHSLQVTSIL